MIAVNKDNIISTMALLAGVMIHIVLSHIARHRCANNILLDSQHGIREKLSTVTQLILSCHDWTTTVKIIGQVDVVFHDFSKAFHKVPHFRISAKLSHYGINGSTMTWINVFLRN